MQCHNVPKFQSTLNCSKQQRQSHQAAASTDTRQQRQSHQAAASNVTRQQRQTSPSVLNLKIVVCKCISDSCQTVIRARLAGPQNHHGGITHATALKYMIVFYLACLKTSNCSFLSFKCHCVNGTDVTSALVSGSLDRNTWQTPFTISTSNEHLAYVYITHNHYKQ